MVQMKTFGPLQLRVCLFPWPLRDWEGEALLTQVQALRQHCPNSTASVFFGQPELRPSSQGQRWKYNLFTHISIRSTSTHLRLRERWGQLWSWPRQMSRGYPVLVQEGWWRPPDCWQRDGHYPPTSKWGSRLNSSVSWLMPWPITAPSPWTYKKPILRTKSIYFKPNIYSKIKYSTCLIYTP